MLSRTLTLPNGFVLYDAIQFRGVVVGTMSATTYLCKGMLLDAELEGLQLRLRESCVKARWNSRLPPESAMDVVKNCTADPRQKESICPRNIVSRMHGTEGLSCEHMVYTVVGGLHIRCWRKQFHLSSLNYLSFQHLFFIVLDTFVKTQLVDIPGGCKVLTVALCTSHRWTSSSTKSLS